MDYKPLKNQTVLGALTRLMAVLDAYNHNADGRCVVLLKERYLLGDISLVDLKVAVYPYVQLGITDLASSIRDISVEFGCRNIFRYYLDHLNTISKLL